MTTVVLLALCGIVAKLWWDVSMLREQVRGVQPDQLAPARPDPYEEALAALRQRPTPVEAPEPEPTSRDGDTSVRSVPTPARTPARIVAGPTAAAEPYTAPRHPGLEPGSRFFDQAKDSEIPGQARDDESLATETVRAEPVEARPTLEREGSPSTSSGRTIVGPNTPTFSFEDIFGRKLPIWAGGVTLAVCGFLIVKYSIDAGLLSPLVRVIGGLLFGAGLIAGAEAALRNEDRVRDPRVRQALAGAGVATLYASVLVAANVYALVPPLAAFGGLALVTLLAAFLSIRFGAPSAVLGLVGGLAAPALVGTGEPNVPLLAGYLALAVGGLATLGRAQRWWWLGAAALVGGFGWGAVLLATGVLDLAGSLSVGAFLLLLGIGLPVLLFEGTRGTIVRLIGALAAAAQLAALVATGGFAMLNWGLFGLLGIAVVWLSRREKALADLPIPALTVALLLMLAWPTPDARELAIVLAGTAAIFGLPAARRMWRADGRLGDAGTIAALSAATFGIPLWHLPLSDGTFALLALAGAALAAGIAALGWRVPSRRDDARFALLVATSGTLLAIASAFGLDESAVAPAWAVIAAGLLLLATRAGDRRIEWFAWVAGLATTTLYATVPGDADALAHAAGAGDQPLLPLEALRWAVGAGAALVFARWGKLRAARSIGEVAAVLFAYVALAQLLPTVLLPLIPAAALAALSWLRRPTAATATAAALAGAWAVWPLAQWLVGATASLAGEPFYVTALPTPTQAALRLFAPALAAALAFWRTQPTERLPRAAWLGAVALLGGTAAHIWYKQLFALDDATTFVRLGMVERTLWEALLALASLALAKRNPDAARALGIAALAHLGWYTLLLHNPLWSEQAVGALPVINLLLPAYALDFALLWAAGRQSLPSIAERARGWAQMLLVLLFAASELRQLVHGSVLIDGGVGEAEDIARSVLAIAIAIGFLQWGIRTRQRDWRIASLVVMLGAVGKVFVFDTSGLHGLMRIGSFAALGFSLIGIGWLYSRYLPDGGDLPSPSGEGSGVRRPHRATPS